MSGALIPFAAGAGARQVALRGATQAAYDAEQALLRARAAGKIGNWAARMMWNKAQRRRRKRARNARSGYDPKHQESRVDVSEIRKADVIQSDTLWDLPLLRNVNIGLGDSARTAKEIFLRGIRINYCLDLDKETNGPIFVRMIVAEDLYGFGENSDYPNQVAFFSGIGSKTPLDFNSTQFVGNVCTKAFHPMNKERWKIYLSKKVVLRQAYAGEHCTKGGHLWVPINEKVRYLTHGATSYPKKDLHFMIFYENGTGEVNQDFISQQIRVQSYFADL